MGRRDQRNERGAVVGRQKIFYDAQALLSGAYANRPSEKAKRQQATTLALQWLTRAAFQEEANAYYLLGSIYADGKLIAKDEVEAYKWFHLATEAKHIMSEGARNALSAKLPPAKIEEAKRRAVQFVKDRETAQARQSRPTPPEDKSAKDKPMK